MNDYSTTEISEDYWLWGEFVDPDNTMTQLEFNAKSIREKNMIQRECFPDECTDIDADGNEI